MRDGSVWQRVLGWCEPWSRRWSSTRTSTQWWCPSALESGRASAAGGVVDGRLGTTVGTDAGGGGPLDVGQLGRFLEADAPRVACPAHGPTVIQVP